MKPMFAILRLMMLSVLFVSSFVWSIDAIELESEKDQERFQALIFELRCPLCQNQNLTDSNSKISVDLRREVVRLIKEGKTDDEIKEHMVSLYGDFILYKPPVQNNTLVLWFGPIVMAGIALLIFAIIVINRSRLASNSEDDDDNVSDEELDELHETENESAIKVGTEGSQDDQNESDSSSSPNEQKN